MQKLILRLEAEAADAEPTLLLLCFDLSYLSCQYMECSAVLGSSLLQPPQAPLMLELQLVQHLLQGNNLSVGDQKGPAYSSQHKAEHCINAGLGAQLACVVRCPPGQLFWLSFCAEASPQLK